MQPITYQELTQRIDSFGDRGIDYATKAYAAKQAINRAMACLRISITNNTVINQAFVDRIVKQLEDTPGHKRPRGEEVLVLYRTLDNFTEGLYLNALPGYTRDASSTKAESREVSAAVLPLNLRTTPRNLWTFIPQATQSESGRALHRSAMTKLFASPGTSPSRATPQMFSQDPIDEEDLESVIASRYGVDEMSRSDERVINSARLLYRRYVRTVIAPRLELDGYKPSSNSSSSHVQEL